MNNSAMAFRPSRILLAAILLAATGQGLRARNGDNGAGLANLTNLAYGKPASMSSVAAQGGTPAGGNDGVVNGRYGFHTQAQRNPWWQVDLLMAQPIGVVQVFNRMDCCWNRADTLGIYISLDGTTWDNVYPHSGASFGGKTDDRPLLVDLGGVPARYVRLQLADTNYLHLDEVKIFAPGQSSLSGQGLALGLPGGMGSSLK